MFSVGLSVLFTPVSCDWYDDPSQDFADLCRVSAADSIGLLERGSRQLPDLREIALQSPSGQLDGKPSTRHDEASHIS